MAGRSREQGEGRESSFQRQRRGRKWREGHLGPGEAAEWWRAPQHRLQLVEAPAAGSTFLLTLLATISLWPLEKFDFQPRIQIVAGNKCVLLEK